MKKTLWLSLVLFIVCTLLMTACNQNDTLSNNEQNFNDNPSCEHTFSDWTTEKQANCKEEGLLTRTCTKCSHKEETKISKTDIHTEVIDAAVSSTCTSTGLTEGKHCGVCGTTLVSQNVTSMLEHSYSSVVTAPTCLERGYTTYTCTCSDSYIGNYVDANGHSFGDWKTVKEATSTEEGLQERTCTCGEKETQLIDKIIKVSDGLEYALNSDGESYSVTGIGFCTDIDIIIPSTYEGKAVTIIGDMAFQNCDLIESITISNNVTLISPFAFESCTSLKNVDFGNGVINIMEATFMGCTSLTSIDIPNSVKFIGEIAFDGCTSLTSIIIPDSLETMNNAFRGCSSLANVYVSEYNQNYCSYNGVLYSKDKTQLIQYPASKTDNSFTIPYTVTNICANAFEGCKFLTSVIIPNGIEAIGNYAFYKCTSLTNIKISDSVTTIGSEAFEYCTSLTSIVIPDSVATINNGAFAGCSSLEMVSIGKNVKNIEGGAFSACNSLTSVNIPNSVTTIGYGAFSDCISLTTIIIPDSVTSLSTRTFEGAINLTIYCVASEKPSGWGGKWNYCASHSNGTNYCTTVWDYTSE